MSTTTISPSQIARGPKPGNPRLDAGTLFGGRNPYEALGVGSIGNNLDHLAFLEFQSGAQGFQRRIFRYAQSRPLERIIRLELIEEVGDERPAIHETECLEYGFSFPYQDILENQIDTVGITGEESTLLMKRLTYAKTYHIWLCFTGRGRYIDNIAAGGNDREES